MRIADESNLVVNQNLYQYFEQGHPALAILQKWYGTHSSNKLKMSSSQSQ